MPPSASPRRVALVLGVGALLLVSLAPVASACTLDFAQEARCRGEMTRGNVGGGVSCYVSFTNGQLVPFVICVLH